MPAVGEANEWPRVRPAVFHFAGPCSTVAGIGQVMARARSSASANVNSSISTVMSAAMEAALSAK